VKTGLLVLPEGWESKLLSGSIDPRFADILKKSLDSSMRFRILGSTLSAGTDETGSRSLGEVHAEKEQERKESDAKGLMESLNQTLIRWIVKLNLDDPTVEREDYPAFRIDYELPKDSAITRENLKVAREFGVPMTLQYVAGELGVEIAPDDTPEEDLVPPMPVAPNPFAFPSGDSREIEDEGADEDKLADLMHRTSHLYAGIHVHSLASVRKRSEQSQRLRDNLEQGAVDAGIPVFDEFKAQIAKWLKKFDTAESALDKFESLKLKTKNFENQIAITFFWSLLNGMDFVYNLPEVKKDLRRKPSDASPMNLQDEWDPVPFQEAIDQFRSKVPLTIKQFNALKSYAKRWALTARGLSVDAIQRELRSALDRAIASGTTLETFLDDLADGNVAVTHRHGETIFRTNVQTAYNTAQAEAMFDPEIADAIPAFRFDAIIDERTTDICEDREGKIFRREDLQVLEIVPPLHYNCRSTVVPLFADEFDSSMLSKAPSVPAAEGFGLFKSILF
jgi:SPP1 gp7 family putative phage head morphogenesis protein